ncbi:hypothetical protein CcI49_19425 [Frankia sp. CcI49]|nr:hypothetical protein CcI49_19425 [Frankia sp. CcI49]
MGGKAGETAPARCSSGTAVDPDRRLHSRTPLPAINSPTVSTVAATSAARAAGHSSLMTIGDGSASLPALVLGPAAGLRECAFSTPRGGLGSGRRHRPPAVRVVPGGHAGTSCAHTPDEVAV